MSIVVLSLFAITPLFCTGQYFNKLYDFDSTLDFGWNVFVQSGSARNYFVEGGAENNHTGRDALVFMNITADGNTVLSKRTILSSDSISYYEGNPGEVKQLNDGGFMIPLTEQIYYTSGADRSAIGLLKLDAALDTVFMKIYTDTSINFDALYALAIMPDGGYLLGAERSYNVVSTPVGLLIRTDSLGNMLWSHTYSFSASQNCVVNTVEAIGSNRILIGAMSTRLQVIGSNTFYFNMPWFIIADSVGNIIKDTLYSAGYGGGRGYTQRHKWRVLSYG